LKVDLLAEVGSDSRDVGSMVPTHLLSFLDPGVAFAPTLSAVRYQRTDEVHEEERNSTQGDERPECLQVHCYATSSIHHNQTRHAQGTGAKPFEAAVRAQNEHHAAMSH
jgi:hypothetical protein